ncbi:hypothetical protein NDU88_003451 [Pleurodeles waltl]|uniref:Uncharacterized protein n=1 Tax=Pleurodeles waltl TaxID=8319 RepID=A0AAV7WVC4_PLEWA|nr:hypothetical protein NDU88_003451 [Pleurodeles waltl]
MSESDKETSESDSITQDDVKSIVLEEMQIVCIDQKHHEEESRGTAQEKDNLKADCKKTQDQKKQKNEKNTN